MKKLKKILAKIDAYWNIKPKPTTREECYMNNGEYSQSYYDMMIGIRKEIAKQEQAENRSKVISIILIPFVALFFIFCFIKVVLIIGLTIGCLLMLLKG